jgi:hypothetical protein
MKPTGSIQSGDTGDEISVFSFAASIKKSFESKVLAIFLICRHALDIVLLVK